MRTLTLERWLLKNRIANFVGGDRRYNVSGAIAFELSWHTFEPGLTLLAETIREVDRHFPWHDDPYPDTKFESIKYLGEGKVVVHNFKTPLKICWFTIVPGINNLRKAQVYAYEKYLSKLAEELSKSELVGVIEVRSIIEVRSVTNFRVNWHGTK